jgi:hypothetical protein
MIQTLAPEGLDVGGKSFPGNPAGARAHGSFSASSRLFDLNGEANNARKEHNSATIVADVMRFCYAIKPGEVFGTHNPHTWTFAIFRHLPSGTQTLARKIRVE